MDQQQAITDFEAEFNGPVPVHLGGHRHRHPSGELRGGDADDDHLRRRHDRAERALPREHAPVVGRPRHRIGLRHDLLQGGPGHPRPGAPHRPPGRARRRRPGHAAGAAAFDASLAAQFDARLRQGRQFLGPEPRPTRRRTRCSRAPGPTSGRWPPTSRSARSSGDADFDQRLQEIQRDYGGGNIDEAQLEAVFHQWMPNQSAVVQPAAHHLLHRVVRHRRTPWRTAPASPRSLAPV